MSQFQYGPPKGDKDEPNWKKLGLEPPKDEFKCPKCGEKHFDNIYEEGPTVEDSGRIRHALCACMTCGFIAFGKSQKDAHRRFKAGDDTHEVYVDEEDLRVKDEQE